MRRIMTCGILLSLAILSAFPAGGSAQSRRPKVANLNLGPRLLPATVCGFRVDVQIVEDHRFQVKLPVRAIAPAGTTVTGTAGEVVLEFVNHATGKAIVREFGGFTGETAYPDGTGTRVEAGRSWIAFTRLVRHEYLAYRTSHQRLRAVGRPRKRNPNQAAAHHYRTSGLHGSNAGWCGPTASVVMGLAWAARSL
jgi:hypothetical protein